MGAGRKNRGLAVRLTAADRSRIEALLRGGVAKVRSVRRAQILRLLDAGKTPPQAARAIGVTPVTARAVGQRYREYGLERAVEGGKAPGNPPLLSAAQRQRIVAMVCGPAPEGRARWTVRLIAEEAVRRKLVRRVGRETIRVLLQSHALKPWREKNVVRRRSDAGLPGADGGGWTDGYAEGSVGRRAAERLKVSLRMGRQVRPGRSSSEGRSRCRHCVYE
jgi:putative transposase